MGLFFGAPERRGFFPEPPIAPFLGGPMSGGAGLNVGRSPDQAMTIPTVWACVSLLAGAVSSLPLEAFAAAAGVPNRLPDPKIITSPDDTMTQSEWLHMLMVSLLLRGNAYGRIVGRNANLQPTQINLLNPDDVAMSTAPDGSLVYRMVRTQRVIPAADMWHVRGLTFPGARIGLSPIAYAAGTLGLDIAARSFAGQFFEGGGIPKAVLESDQQLDQTQALTLKQRVMASLTGRDPLVLGSGLKYTQIQVRPDEAQFLQTQAADVGQIARFFSVPASMVGGQDGGSLTYSNREQRSLDFLTYSLSHWLKRIEDAMFVLLPGRQYVRFNVAELLRTDAETQAKIDIQYVAGRVKAPSEIRARLGLDPMTDAQKAESDLVPLTITPLGAPKGLPALHNTPGAEAPVPTAEQGVTSAA